MRLVEICEPLFQYVCTLNRSARKGGGIYDQSQVRADIKQLLADTRYAASADAGASQRYDEIEMVLLFFIDSMIKRSALPFAEDWEDLAYERQELAGEDRFFEMLDKTLEDKSEGAVDKLAVYYMCLGLGFTGWHTGQPEVLRKKMLEISARIRPYLESNPQTHICPDAYAHVNQSNLIQPPAASLVGIGIGLVGLVLVLMATYVYLYRDGTRQLVEALDRIVSPDDPSRAPSAAPAAAAGRAGAAEK